VHIGWHENGQKKDEGNFKVGKLDGKYTEWYEDGQKKDEGNFKDGKLDGKYTEWYENGQIKKETNCEDGKYIEAILSFKQAIWIDPDDADAHYNLGNAYGESGRYEEAIEPYKQVLRINPDYTGWYKKKRRNAHYNLGLAYGMLGKHKEAIESFKQANPYSADTHYNLGNAYGELGRYEEAIESYKQAIGIANYHGDAHYNLGLVYDKLGRREEALESHKQAVKMKSRDADALYNLACCYSFFGNVNKALEWLDRAIIFGFDDIKHIENDSDLNGLRDEAGYKRLINKLKGETLINAAIGQDSKANLGSVNMEGSKVKNGLITEVVTGGAGTATTEVVTGGAGTATTEVVTGGTGTATTLRSSYKTLSVSQVHSMPNMSIRKKENWGFYGYSRINHDYNLKTIGGDKVAVDNATGLMWHQSGSDDQMHWDDAKEWVEDLNSEGYAGYQDWRLPTVDEAASLLEPNKRIGRYIDPVFNKKQQWIWTGNEVDGSEAAWSVYFGNGHVYRSYFIDIHSVRPVRTME
jgi:tetratricopeptide (TPR) repeat protein